MITLYKFGEAFGLPDASPFVTKAEILLKMAGLDYKSDFDGFGEAPRGKLPYLKDDGEIVADSTLIRLHIEDKYSFDFDVDLDERQRGLAWAVEKLMEDNLYWTMLSQRWMHEGNFDFGPSMFFEAVPEPGRAEMIDASKKKIARTLSGQGTGLHSEEEKYQLAIRTINHAAAILGKNNYIMGANPCGADGFIFAILAGVSAKGFDTPLIGAVDAHGNLVDYLARMHSRYFG